MTVFIEFHNVVYQITRYFKAIPDKMISESYWFKIDKLCVIQNKQEKNIVLLLMELMILLTLIPESLTSFLLKLTLILAKSLTTDPYNWWPL